jgi:hypothetical protein
MVENCVRSEFMIAEVTNPTIANGLWRKFSAFRGKNGLAAPRALLTAEIINRWRFFEFFE